MANIFDYIKWRGDLSFTQDPVNAVDALIFSALSYIRYVAPAEVGPDAPVTLRKASSDYFIQDSLDNKYRVKSDMDLLRAAAESNRFGLTKLCMYREQFIPEQETQFAAMTFLLDDGTMFLAFRGTDSTLIGWKEDFNMAFQQTVPSQLMAVEYVREVAAEYALPMRLGGHSKGGNVAVFASARSSPMVQQRILEVYNNDGPGFTKYLMGDPGYLAMVPRIKTYIPQSSVIGMLLEHEEPYTVISSKSVGLLQHDPYSWEVMVNGLIPMEGITESSQFLDTTIKTWFSNMTNQERGKLVDAMFELLGTGDVDKAMDIFHPKNLHIYLKTLSGDENMRKILSTEFQSLMEATRKARAKLEGGKTPPDLPREEDSVTENGPDWERPLLP